MNTGKLADLVKKLLKLLGEDVTREGLQDTPQRVAQSYKKLFEGYNVKIEDFLTVFDSEKYDEMIVVKDIEFYSFCEHHMLPFFGKVHVGYIPNGKIVGLSKIPRIVDMFSRRLQNQERITQEIAECLMNHLNPKGVGVVVEAKHFCMMARGVEKQNSFVRTSAMMGLFKSKDNTRAEFLELIR